MPEGKGLLEISISVIICWTSLSRGSNTFHYTILHLALSADAPDPRKGQRPVCSTGWVWPSHWHWRWQLRTFRSSNDDQRHVWPWRTPGNCSHRSANPCVAPAPGGRGVSPALTEGELSCLFLVWWFSESTQHSFYLPGEISKEKASFPVQLCIRTWLAAFLEM